MKRILVGILAFILSASAPCGGAGNTVLSRDVEGRRFARAFEGLGAVRFNPQARRRKPKQRRREAPAAGVSFQTLVRAAPAVRGPDSPVVYVAGSVAGLQSFARLLSPDHARMVADVDFSEHAVLAVFAGMKGSSGYEILVERVKTVNGRLQVAVKLTQPAAQGYALQVLTSPYHIVLVRKADLRAAAGSYWVLTDTRGARLAAGRGN